MVDSESSLIYGLAGLAVFLLALRFLDADKRSLDAIPTVGPSAPLLSYIGAFKTLFDAPGVVQEGYNKFKGSAFKIATFNRWIVVISGPKLIDELRRAPDDVLSFSEATSDMLSIEYTLGPNARRDEYHITVIRTQLTRALPSMVAIIRDEVVEAFNDEIAPKGDEWIKLPALETTMKVVCRASNRIFVGLPLCRNADYGDLNVEFALNVLKGALVLDLFPKFMKPLVGNLLTSVPRSIRRASEHLRPLIEERLRMMKEYGEDWPDKPNDMLAWLMEEAKGEERSVEAWALRILLVNFAAIHTSSMSFTHALYHLAANPEYIQPMRDEIEAVMKEDGWTKTAMHKMRKVDSFLRESMRFTGIDCLALSRTALKPFTFSDGTYVPAHTYIAVAQSSTHLDEENYSNPEIFDGFRFANLRQEEGEGLKHQFVSTGNEYVPFGHGRHSCPGRFFAAAELKAMLAHLVLTYDVKLENEGVRPKDLWFGTSRSPNRTAEVMFRKRQT